MKQDLPVSLFHLLEGMRGIKRRDGDVAAVDDTHANVATKSLADSIARAPACFVSRVREWAKAI